MLPMPFSRVVITAFAGAFALTALPLGHPAAAATVTNEATAIFAKHAAYVGQPQGLVLTYRAKATAKAPVPKTTPAPGEPPPFARSSTTYRRGQLYRSVDEFGGVTEQEGFTGRAFWSSNVNGFTVIDYEDAARRMLTANVIDGDLLGPDVSATSRGTKTIDGTAVDVVRVTPASGIPADIAFDQKTGAYVEVTYDPDNRYERGVVHIDGYTEVAPGIRVPSGYHTGEYVSWALAEKAVRAVTNDDLRGPVPTAKWNFASTDTAPIEVVEHQTPYAFMPRGQAVHVRASIGGHVGTFLLDSGASSIVIYRPYADKLKMTKLGRTGFSGVNGGGVAARYMRLDDAIAIGKNTLSNVVVTVADGEFSEGIDGILGYDFLAGGLVDVDIAKQTIRILDPSTMQPAVGAGAYAFPVNLASRQPEIGLKVAGVPARAIFDTGDDFLAVLSDDLQSSGRIVALNDKIRVGGQEVDYQISFYGVDGPAQAPARCSRLSQLDVGPYKYQNVETCFAPAKAFGRDGGLIGFDFLKHFNWTFDYPESTFVLTPNGK